MKVSELKELLKSIPDDYEIVIEDADTDWILSNVTVITKPTDSELVFYSGYGNVKGY